MPPTIGMRTDVPSAFGVVCSCYLPLLMLDQTSSDTHWTSPFSLFAPEGAGRLLRGMGADLILVSASFGAAHLLRFGGFPSTTNTTQFFVLLIVIALMKVSLFRWFQLYQGLWAHAGTPEAIRLVQASSIASVGVLGAILAFQHDAPVPIAVLVLDWMLTVATTGGRRFGQRAWNQYRTKTTDGGKKVLIYGADRYGVFLLRYLRHVAPGQYSVVGFYDPAASSHELKGLPLVPAAESTEADSIIVPVPPDAETSERNCSRGFADCAELDLDCQQFQLAISAADAPVTANSARTAYSTNERA